MRSVPDIASVRAIRPDALDVFVACEQDGMRTAYAVVKATKYDLGVARPIEVNNCTVRMLSEEVFQLNSVDSAGDVIWLNNQYQLLVSVNGSPAISVQDDQIKALKKKMRTRIEENEDLRDERDKPRQEQEKQYRLGAIKQASDTEHNEQKLARLEAMRQQKVYEQEYEAFYRREINRPRGPKGAL